MFGPLLFVAGAVGGLISLAFLVGVLIVEPLAFFIVMAIAALMWHLAGKPWTRWGRENQGSWFADSEPPTYDDDEDF